MNRHCSRSPPHYERYHRPRECVNCTHIRPPSARSFAHSLVRSPIRSPIRSLAHLPGRSPPRSPCRYSRSFHRAPLSATPAYVYYGSRGRSPGWLRSRSRSPYKAYDLARREHLRTPPSNYPAYAAAAAAAAQRRRISPPRFLGRQPDPRGASRERAPRSPRNSTEDMRMHEVPANTHYKTRLCNNFMQGECARGRSCCFAHGQNELRSFPAQPLDSSPPREYHDHQANRDSRHQVQPNAPSMGSDFLGGPSLLVPRYPRTMCRTYSSTGECPYGGKCFFLHGSNDRRIFASATHTERSTAHTVTHDRVNASPNIGGLIDFPKGRRNSQVSPLPPPAASVKKIVKKFTGSPQHVATMVAENNFKSVNNSNIKSQTSITSTKSNSSEFPNGNESDSNLRRMQFGDLRNLISRKRGLPVEPAPSAATNTATATTTATVTSVLRIEHQASAPNESTIRPLIPGRQVSADTKSFLQAILTTHASSRKQQYTGSMSRIQALHNDSPEKIAYGAPDSACSIDVTKENFIRPQTPGSPFEDADYHDIYNSIEQILN